MNRCVHRSVLRELHREMGGRLAHLCSVRRILATLQRSSRGEVIRNIQSRRNRFECAAASIEALGAVSPKLEVSYRGVFVRPHSRTRHRGGSSNLELETTASGKESLHGRLREMPVGRTRRRAVGAADRPLECSERAKDQTRSSRQYSDSEERYLDSTQHEQLRSFSPHLRQVVNLN